MDPKNLSNLDPKLRETYERVMGAAANSTPNTSTPPAPAASTNPMPTFDAMPNPTTTPIPPPSDPSTTTTPDAQAAELSAMQPTLSPTQSLPPAQHFDPLPSPAEVNQLPAQASKSTSPVIRILYIIAGVIFFAVYAIFWLKVFNFPLPF